MTCLQQMAGLCPASRYDEMAAELVSSIVPRIFSGSHDEADTEEQVEPPMECQPYWFGDDESRFESPPVYPKKYLEECQPYRFGDDGSCCATITLPHTETPQIVIQVLVAEIDLDGSSDWLTAGSD